jgi:UDP-glucose 4-epimerase
MILLTGGTGYIGSHTCVELITTRHPVIIFDNLSNSNLNVLRRIKAITGVSPTFVEGDLRDAEALARLFKEYPIKAVIHFAGKKAVGESVADPLSYYDNNTIGTVRLLEAMQAAGVKQLVFSSSATVYGDPRSLPLSEFHPLNPTSPYGRTKLFIEDILRDLAAADSEWKMIILRYFNPVGAHESGLIGEDPLGVPGNLVPFVAQVATGQREHIRVWGNDYPTPDGTGIRDYVHVVDIANGHILALESLATSKCLALNLGTGSGSSVLEVIDAFCKASGRQLPYEFYPRRPGDVASFYADPRAAEAVLGWKAKRSLQKMCDDHWNWQRTKLNTIAE